MLCLVERFTSAPCNAHLAFQSITCQIFCSGNINFQWYPVPSVSENPVISSPLTIQRTHLATRKDPLAIDEVITYLSFDLHSSLNTPTRTMHLKTMALLDCRWVNVQTSRFFVILYLKNVRLPITMCSYTRYNSRLATAMTEILRGDMECLKLYHVSLRSLYRSERYTEYRPLPNTIFLVWLYSVGSFFSAPHYSH